MAKKIRIGLCMAGAVSAGAYTAGVIDYFCEALDRLSELRKTNPEIPEVVIDVLSGTSAGGMTALITAAALHREMPHVDHTNFRQTEIAARNPLFNAWINLRDTPAKSTIEKMCSLEDLQEEGGSQAGLHSIFNSSFIDQIANGLVEDVICKTPLVERDYVSKDLQVIACMSNLKGFEIKQPFNGATSSHHSMKQHRDLGHFEVGTMDAVAPGRLPLNFKSVQPHDYRIFRDVAMATGAFPIGLRPRVVSRPTPVVQQSKHINPLGLIQFAEDDNEVYSAVMVDGGAFNNEPYDITMKELDERTQPGELYCVIMIDPIPNLSSEEINRPYQHPNGIGQYASGIIAALQNETNCKVPLNKEAIDSSKDGLFLIKPMRKGGSERLDNHIACAALNRFGGFFSRRFREHDYLLGRRNCKSFLMRHFRMELQPGQMQLVFPPEVFLTNGVPNALTKQLLIPYPKMYARRMDYFKGLFKSRLNGAIKAEVRSKKSESLEKQSILKKFDLMEGAWSRITSRFFGYLLGLFAPMADNFAAKILIDRLIVDLGQRKQLTNDAQADQDQDPVEDFVLEEMVIRDQVQG